uniref:F-box domain-containing protein n=1 Tax=Leersia perrieri TaxID=77586 RepID=A0A0D9UX58_9ORYZ
MAAAVTERRIRSKKRKATEAKKRRVRSRKRKACGGGVVRLPDHVVAEVLVRLPARSLARLRCACRSWNAEISSPGFQDRHHALSAAKLAFLPSAPRHTNFNLTIQSRNGRPRQWLTYCHDCPRTIGSNPCHGLVLLWRLCGDEEHYYSVYNPTTGDILHLPSPHQPDRAVGIGFHAAAREFKVVAIRIVVQLGELHAIVLTIGDARGWRRPAASTTSIGFTGDEYDDVRIERERAVFADGRLHWILTTKYLDKGPHSIVSFSLADESLCLIPQPPFATADLVPFDLNAVHFGRLSMNSGVRSESHEMVSVPVGTTIAELGGRLCMVRDVRHMAAGGGGGLLFEIWKLQDYETRSWTLDYRVDLKPAAAGRRRDDDRLTAPWLVMPLMYLDDDAGGGFRPGEGKKEKRKLLLATTAHEAHVYDPDSGTLRTVASFAGAGDSWEDGSLRVMLYQESLVRFPGLKQGKGEVEFVRLEV